MSWIGNETGTLRKNGDKFVDYKIKMPFSLSEMGMVLSSLLDNVKN